MKAVRGQWMLVSLVLGLAFAANAEVASHNGSGAGTARRSAPGETPQRVFSNALNACGLSQGAAGLSSTFTAAPPPPPPPPVFPEGGGDVAPTLTEGETASAGGAGDKVESKATPEPPAQASTESKSEAKPVSASAVPPPKANSVNQSQALAIMTKVNCTSCHGDGRKASDYTAKELAEAFIREPRMRKKLVGAEVKDLESFLASK